MSVVAEPLLERGAEVAALDAALSGARAGRGAAVLLDGEAGIGKTTLLAVARRSAAAHSMRCLDARAAPLETGEAYGIARQLLLPAVLGEGGAERLLRGAAGLARPALLGLGGNAGPSGDSGFAVRHGLSWLVAALATDDPPLVLLVDDLHWADAASVRFLAILAARVADLPIALLLAARPPDAWSDPTLAGELPPSVQHLALARLTLAGVTACLAGQLGIEPEREFAEIVRRQTSGTPYLVAALGRALRASGTPPTAQAAGSVAELGGGELGRDVAARVLALTADERALVAAVAVVGDGRPAAEATALAGLDPEAAARAAVALRAVGLLDGWPLPAFDHPLVRTALLEAVGATHRATLHGQAAALAAARGEPERAAAHLAGAPGIGAPDRVQLLQEVGERALRRGAADVAVGHLRRALAEPPTPGALHGVLMHLGLAELAIGDPACADRLSAAASATDDPEQALRARMISGHALTYGGQWAPAFARMQEAIDRAGAASHGPLMLARLELATAQLTCIDTGREASTALDELERELPGDDPLRPLLATSCALRDTVRALWRAPAREVLTATAMDAPEIGGATLYGARLVALVLTDSFDEAEGLLEASIAISRRRGDMTILRMSSAWRALGLARQGRPADAAQALLAVTGDPAWGPQPVMAEVIAAVVSAWIALDRGDVAAAAAAVAPPLERDPRIAAVTLCDDLLVARGRVRLAEDDPAAAAALFARAAERQERWGGESPPSTQWRLWAARAAWAQGDHAAARGLAREETIVAERFGAPRPLAMALRAQALTCGSAVAAERDLRAALDCLGGEQLELERARCCVALGELLIEGGRAEAAREPLRSALELAWSGGADTLAERARSGLVAAGARPRRPQRSGVLALTAAEARTARLAGQLGNREIAEQLFVTEKTVESHLTSAYRKLQITGRAQLTAALEEP